MLGLVLAMLIHSIAYAELKSEGVYPTLGKTGKDLAVSLTGTGFDENTRVSIYLDAGSRKAIIGSVDIPGLAFSVTVVGDTAYVAHWNSGLQVIDISNPQSPEIIGSVDTPGYAEDVAVVGDKAYVADGDGGLQIIDIGDPEAPWIIGPIDTPGRAHGVAVVGDRAYVADDDGGLQVIDISDPEKYRIIGSVTTPGLAFGVVVMGDNAYVSDRDSGLQVIDIRSPESPLIIGSVDTPGWAFGITVAGDNAYVADGGSGLQVIDIRNPQSPEIIGSVDTPGYAENVFVGGNRAYVADGISGLQMVDISSPESPRIIEYIDTPGYAESVTVVGDKAYVADNDRGLQVIGINNPQGSQVIGSADTPGRAHGVTVVGDTAYVAAYGGGFQVIDIRNPEVPQVIGSLDVPMDTIGVTVVGFKAYVASFLSGLLVIDISIPENPQLVGSLEPSGYAEDVTVVGETAYVAAGGGGLQVIDISNPQSLTIVGSVDTPGYADGIIVVGDIAYVADGGSGLQVIDISTPEHPEVIGSVDTPGYAEDITVAGDKAYVADGWKGLQVISISDLESLQIIGSVYIQGGSAHGITVLGDRAFIANGVKGLGVIDISNPQSLQVLGSVDTPGYALDVMVAGDEAYVADEDSGLVIVPLPIEVSPIVLNSETSIFAVLPGPQIAGHYTLRAFNDSENHVLPGAVTFAEGAPAFSGPGPIPEPDPTAQVTPVSKAIILAGGGPYAGNTLWEATRRIANYAYQTLLYQGYTIENIYFLSPDTAIDVDGDGIPNDVYADATLDNLSYALSTWAKDPEFPAYELLFFMVGPGGDATFRMNETTLLRTETLDRWLDDLQATMPGKIMVIYDACQSGTFIPELLPPDGKERILITSASNEPAVFLNQGGLSFSYPFWSSIFNGSEIDDAYIFGKDMIGAHQTALLEASGDIDPNQTEDRTAVNDMVIGRGYIPASDVPYISFVSESQTLSGESTANLWAKGIIDANGIQRVWAVIRFPEYSPDSLDTPIVELPTIDLTDADGDHVYEGAFNDFSREGTYSITIYAVDDGAITSLPRQTAITQTHGIKAQPKLILTIPDICTEGDGVLFNKGTIIVRTPPDGHLTISLISEEPPRISVIGTASILPGETVTAFDIGVVDDAVGDGEQWVKITASAPGYEPGVETIIVFDDDPPSIAGDVNNDGIVDLADAILGLKAISGSGMGDANISVGADVNDDRKIGIAEVVYIARKVAGLK